MSKGGPGGGQQGDENSMALLWILALIFLACGLLWYFFSKELIIAFLYVRKAEALAVSFATSKLDNVLVYLNNTIPFVTKENFNLDTAIDLSERIGAIWMYPVIALFVLMSLYMLKNHSHMRWHTKHSMDTLVKQEQKNWPQISPVVPLDLVDQDINKGPWAISMNPMQFAKSMKILDVEKIANQKAAWKAGGEYRAILSRERAHRAFVNQMGPMWTGIDNLPPHTKALFSMFAARIEHEPDIARAYSYELAASAARGEMNYSKTNELLAKFAKAKAVQQCTARHAYVYTVMASMLLLARTDGVAASADFLWLKPVDRRLWFVLNTVGRQVAPAEIAGPWAHWIAEKEMHRGLSVPMVDEAINALVLALDKMIYLPDDEEEENLLTAKAEQGQD